MSDQQRPNEPTTTANRERWSPKTRILLIALGFFLFNVMLVAIWAWVLFGR